MRGVMAASKQALIAELRRRVDADLDAVTASQMESAAGATHEEARAEGDKDMRSTETSYVARGLAMRVAELREASAALARFAVRAFDDDDAVAIGAVVEVDDEDGASERYLIAPAGAGVTLDDGGAVVRVITPASPLARALLGSRVDDEVTLDSPRGPRTLTIVGLA